jgi:glycosyltransferase involved in cell wall biosynthesis
LKALAVTDTAVLSGAGIAARRIHQAVRSVGIDSRLAVARASAEVPDAIPLFSRSGRLLHSVRRATAKTLLSVAGADTSKTLSLNMLPSHLGAGLARFDADLVHLHWIGLEMIRVEEIAEIRKPLIWTLHDEWFNLGIDHYTNETSYDGLLGQLDRYARLRKKKTWERTQPYIVCPSQWLARQVAASMIELQHRIEVIPNPVPIEIYKPADRHAARMHLGLRPNTPVIGVGSLNTLNDPRKGYRLLVDALAGFRELDSTLKPLLLVFGAEAKPADLPLAVHFAGTLIDDQALASTYAAMDVFVCPSLQENLPNTLAEALASGIPCVAFDVGGISDLIEHRRNGYLARSRDVRDLFEGIVHCLAPVVNEPYGIAARERAVAQLSPRSVGHAYAELYRRVLA